MLKSIKPNENDNYSSRKKFADGLKDYKEIKKLKTTTLLVNETDFHGDICLHHFLKVNEKIVLPNGICFMDTDYKWLEFYDYSAKNRLTAMYNEKNEIIEWYFDISRKIGKENGVPYEDDMYLDIVIMPDGNQILLDKDELDKAFQNNEISEVDYNNAIKEAESLMELMKGKQKDLKRFTDKYLRKLLEN